MNQENVVINYSMAMKNYNQNGRGRSMRKFCEDEGYDLYQDRVDLIQGISGLSRIVRNALGLNPYAYKSIYVFSSRHPRIKNFLK